MLRSALQLDEKGQMSLPKFAVDKARAAAAAALSGNARGDGADDAERELESAERELEAALRSASLVLAIHPDEATDWVLDYALEHDLPFAVVPCCVHWKAFPSRQVDGKPVRTIDDLIEYLKRRGGPGTLTAELGFEGQSTVVYKL